MLYRKDRYGNELSQLGFGCMRFSRKGTAIDFDKAEAEILKAYEMGVNYYDTAYIYPGSEEFLGKALEKNDLRDKVKIATKLPQYLMRSMSQAEKTFKEELSRLRTDHVDYYLMHMFTDIAEWERLKALGIEEWIARHKADGSIRQIGFSYHGERQMFAKILDSYDWDFCQIQYNYLDEHSQAGVEGLKAAAKKGIPVIIMEPLRGGKLVKLPESARKVLKESGRDYSPADWSFRWLWNQEEVTVVLSGMNSLEMVEENCRSASSAMPGDLKESDLDVIDRIRKEIRAKEKVGCTGCRYCMPCPKGVDIPGNFYYYNLMYIDGKTQARYEFAQAMGFRKEPGFASQCVGCGKCEQHCPQHLSIREKLKEADKALRPLPVKAAIEIARKFMVRKK
ncbi:MAG: aldo/keto reductase [Lachnospiraceae bacterium]|nr:aldo/keto reductase [Lachnospiraceae bacterium]